MDAEEKNIRGDRGKIQGMDGDGDGDGQVGSGQVQSGSDVTYRKELTG